MTNVIQVPSIATKGHYLGLSSDALKIAAPIQDSYGNPIQPDENDDDTMIGVEHYSGLSVFSQQRLQINYYIQQDILYNWLKSDIITPLAYVKRESSMSQDQVSQFLGTVQD